MAKIQVTYKGLTPPDLVQTGAFHNGPGLLDVLSIEKQKEIGDSFVEIGLEKLTQFSFELARSVAPTEMAVIISTGIMIALHEMAVGRLKVEDLDLPQVEDAMVEVEKYIKGG